MKTLSEEYRKILIETHAEKQGTWGVTAKEIAPYIMSFVQKAGEQKILDYGAGPGYFGKFVQGFYPDIEVIDYEPSREDAWEPPEPCGFVVCVDVLEHIEPAYLENVLDDLKRVTLHQGFFQVATRPAKAILSDGRNAHLIIKPFEWWLPKLEDRFKILHTKVVPKWNFEVLVEKW